VPFPLDRLLHAGWLGLQRRDYFVRPSFEQADRIHGSSIACEIRSFFRTAMRHLESGPRLPGSLRSARSRSHRSPLVSRAGKHRAAGAYHAPLVRGVFEKNVSSSGRE